MSVDNDRLALAGQRFSNALSLDQNLHTNSRASSGFTQPSALRRVFNISHRAPRSVTDVLVLNTDSEKTTPETRKVSATKAPKTTADAVSL